MSEFSHIRGAFLDVDMRQFGELSKFFEQFPKQARAAVAQLINDVAFKAREQAPKTLAEHVVIRNPRFVQSRIRVQKTRIVDIAKQVAYVGSVAGPRFTGWTELETGAEPARNRILTLLSRGGDVHKQVRARNRLKPGADIPKPGDWDDARGGTSRNRVQAMIRAVHDSGVYGKLVLIPQNASGGMSPGLYRVTQKRRAVAKWGGRKAAVLKIVQRFGKRPKSKRVDWIGETVNTTLRSVNWQQMWQAAIKRVVERSKPKT